MFNNRIPKTVLQCLIENYESTHPNLTYRIAVSSKATTQEMDDILFAAENNLVWIILPEACTECKKNDYKYCSDGLHKLFLSHPKCAHNLCIGCLPLSIDTDFSTNHHLVSDVSFLLFSHGSFALQSCILPLVKLKDSNDMLQMRATIREYGPRVMEYATLRLLHEFYDKPGVSEWSYAEWYGTMVVSNTHYFTIPPIRNVPVRVIFDWYEGYHSDDCGCVLPINYRLVQRLQLDHNLHFYNALRHIEWKETLIDYPTIVDYLRLFVEYANRMDNFEQEMRIAWDFFDAIIPCESNEALYCEHHSYLKYRVDRALDYANSPVYASTLPFDVSINVFRRFNRSADRMLTEFEALYDNFRVMEISKDKSHNYYWTHSSRDQMGKYVLDFYLE